LKPHGAAVIPTSLAIDLDRRVSHGEQVAQHVGRCLKRRLLTGLRRIDH
jgi:hypothetical protein